jgi:hypothetical protein
MNLKEIFAQRDAEIKAVMDKYDAYIEKLIADGSMDESKAVVTLKVTALNQSLETSSAHEAAAAAVDMLVVANFNISTVSISTKRGDSALPLPFIDIKIVGGEVHIYKLSVLIHQFPFFHRDILTKTVISNLEDLIRKLLDGEL